ncbi:MAG: adenosine deaminase family protein [Proteobacteria bacterium]|nr:adenosine deaminase family protein [Pseudomonadota bacterium]
MTRYPREFLLAIPKSDLHLHLDGSMRLSTLIELARQQKISLPADTEEGLKKAVFKERYRDLVEYLRGFQYTTAVMQTPEALERVAYELCLDSFSEGVRYIEVRFAPQLHSNASMTVDDVLVSVDRGLRRAEAKINAGPDIKSGDEPKFHYGIIGCAMRMFDEQSATYYRRLREIHPYMPEDDMQALASIELVRSLVHARNELGVPIAGFDLAGAEHGYPAEKHRQAYDLAHKHFIKKTVHAGEAYGPASIFQAITDCHADRIGHGTHLFDTSLVDLPTKEERETYVKELWEYIADRRITIEVCLTSNLQTMPHIKGIGGHPLKEMLARRMSVTFCTDNRLISNTTVTKEIELAVTNFEIAPKALKDLIVYGFKRSFYPADYRAKRSYVRSVIDYYEKLEKALL